MFGHCKGTFVCNIYLIRINDSFSDQATKMWVQIKGHSKIYCPKEFEPNMYNFSFDIGWEEIKTLQKIMNFCLPDILGFFNSISPWILHPGRGKKISPITKFHIELFLKIFGIIHIYHDAFSAQSHLLMRKKMYKLSYDDVSSDCSIEVLLNSLDLNGYINQPRHKPS